METPICSSLHGHHLIVWIGRESSAFYRFMHPQDCILSPCTVAALTPRCRCSVSVKDCPHKYREKVLLATFRSAVYEVLYKEMKATESCSQHTHTFTSTHICSISIGGHTPRYRCAATGDVCVCMQQGLSVNVQPVDAAMPQH